MKRLLFTAVFVSTVVALCMAQQELPGDAQAIEKVNPNRISKAVYHDVSPPLRDLPALTKEQYQQIKEDAQKKRNKEL